MLQTVLLTFTFPTSVSAAICVKEDDVYVSRAIIENGAWEEENVLIALKAMDFYRDAVFIGEANLDIFLNKSCLCGRCWIQHRDVHHHDGRHE